MIQTIYTGYYYLQAIVVAALGGAAADSWYVGGAIFVAIAVIPMFSTAAGKTIGILLGMSWGHIGTLLAHGRHDEEVVLGLFFALMGIGVNLAAVDSIRAEFIDSRKAHSAAAAHEEPTPPAPPSRQ